MSQSVSSVDWQSILKLLMHTMLADGRAYERQADTFVDTSIDLRSNMKVRGFQTRQMTMDWYIRHRKELVDVQSGKTFEADILSLIDSLNTIPDKKPLIRALKNLSKRESEIKDPETAIVTLSKSRWSMG